MIICRWIYQKICKKLAKFLNHKDSELTEKSLFDLGNIVNAKRNDIKNNFGEIFEKKLNELSNQLADKLVILTHDIDSTFNISYLCSIYSDNQLKLQARNNIVSNLNLLKIKFIIFLNRGQKAVENIYIKIVKLLDYPNDDYVEQKKKGKSIKEKLKEIMKISRDNKRKKGDSEKEEDEEDEKKEKEKENQKEKEEEKEKEKTSNIFIKHIIFVFHFFHLTKSIRFIRFDKLNITQDYLDNASLFSIWIW